MTFYDLDVFWLPVCRQMCYSCNYVGNILSQGYECVSYPKNWTYGNWRLRCNNKCTTQSTYDKGEYKYPPNIPSSIPRTWTQGSG